MSDEFDMAPSDGFRASDFDAKVDVSIDFVERTLRRVIEDRAEIEAEALRVDEISFDAELLAELAPPSVSDGFVDRVAGAIDDARQSSWQNAMASYAPPSPSDDFVDRTLSALQLERSGLRLVADADAAEPVRMRRVASALAIAAALIATALLIFSTTGPDPAERNKISVAQDFSPTPWSTATSSFATSARGELAFHPVGFGDGR